MATQVIEILSDSLDERIKNGVENVVFFHPVTGQKLEIQLGEANRKHFANHLEKLAKYIDAAEVVEVPVVETKPKAAAKNSENVKIRTWAREHGFTIGDRGRISGEIMAAYTAAHEVIETEQPDAEVVSDLQLDEVTEPAESVSEEPTEVAAEQNDETASTEEEIMKAFDEGKISAGAVMELLDEISEVDGDSEQE